MRVALSDAIRVPAGAILLRRETDDRRLTAGSYAAQRRAMRRPFGPDSRSSRGHARGVDVEAHIAAIAAGGSTIIVLAEGIARFRLKRALADAGIQPGSLLVLSQFPPRQGWTVGGAMTRNALIAALGLALVVIEAGETGGTLDAGLKGLDLNRPVLALSFLSGHRAGNEILQSKGARLIPSTGALRDAIAMIRRSAGDQMRLFDSAATSTGPLVRR